MLAAIFGHLRKPAGISSERNSAFEGTAQIHAKLHAADGSKRRMTLSFRHSDSGASFEIPRLAEVL